VPVLVWPQLSSSPAAQSKQQFPKARAHALRPALAAATVRNRNLVLPSQLADITCCPTDSQTDSQTGLPVTKQFTRTLRTPRKDSSKWDKGIWFRTLQTAVDIVILPVPGKFARRPIEYTNTIRQNAQYDPHPPVAPPVTDLAGKVKGMYRLLDLIGESGSNGYGRWCLVRCEFARLMQ